MSSFLSSSTLAPETQTRQVDRERRSLSGRPADLLDHHRLVTITGGPMWESAERFVHDTYVELGYTAPSARKHVEELAPYESMSIFHAVVDEDDQIVGTVRNIFGSYDDLPVGKFHRIDGVDPDPLCELSSLVVSPSVRSTGVIEHLYRTGWLDAFRMGCHAVVAIIDDWLLDVFQQNYGLPFRQIGSGREYMGGVPVPVALSLDGTDYDDLARRNPLFWEWVLEEVSDSEFEEWALPPVGGNGPVRRPSRQLSTIR
ncbi:MAG: hypothetical protein KDB02_08005 [Acidimicrobiales bacterium]|nr:hypothetical protein [Acidimicrobiales bacterium]MCB1246734.1 hypothetical protein [Acidimicrobiia bacterium]